MSVETIRLDASKRWCPEDLDALDGENNRHEIADGVLEMTPPAMPGHTLAVSNLIAVIQPQLPATFGCACDPAITIGASLRMPDFAIVQRLSSPTVRRYFTGEDFALVAEVVSPSTAANDRFVKVAEYARAGIPVYLIVDVGARTIQLLELEAATGQYQRTGSFTSGETIALHAPLPLSIPVADVVGQGA